jgi:hypothetical protein
MTKQHEELRIPSGGSEPWAPVIGETTEGLGEFLVRDSKLPSREAYARVRGEALEILRQCRPIGPADGQRTGLVVGYVQSGKTMSMTTVSALARDNGCRIIIMLAGVTKNLLRQNSSRLMDQLRAASGASGTVWRIQNSEDGVRPETDGQHLRQAVSEWRDSSFSEVHKQTFIFAVLKNHAHLERLHSLLRSVDLRGIPALILDDEADQAGLNTNPDPGEDPSATYRWINAVRQVLPNHTYLQYTATPQAPLLISIDDMLSPSFAQLVEPGDGYTGGRAFFGAGSMPGLVVPIPEDEQFRPGSPPASPPDSLISSLRIFFVGCAVARVRGGPRTRSMLVHPSQRTADHGIFLQWINAIIERWSATLRSSSDPDYADTLEEFQSAYGNLATTDTSLPAFADLLVPLRLSLSRVVRKEVNSQDGSEVDWKNGDEHILVGGEKLNRGYTVEGLTVTYMPRDAGGWNADTLQQRARFFGYKASYLPLCRLFLHPQVIQAYRAYVRHEDDMRGQLARHHGQPLKEWRRAFFLDASLRPTRQNVLADPFYRVRADDVWFVQRWPHLDPGAEQRNMALAHSIEGSHTFEKGPFRNHGFAVTTVGSLFEDFFLQYQVRGSDIASWYGQLVVLSELFAHDPSTSVTVLNMSPRGDGKLRERAATDDGVQPHQGRSSSAGIDNYPGDKKMVAGVGVTLQLHWLEVTGRGPSIAVALHIPELLRDDVLAQPQ